MKISPLIFSGPMVRAILTGRKTQTRRLTWRQCDAIWVRETWRPGSAGIRYRADQPDGPNSGPWRPPIHLAKTGCRLVLPVARVRTEPLQAITNGDAIDEGAHTLPNPPDYRERLNAALAAASVGQKPPLGLTPRERFIRLWEDLHGPGSWEANPIVHVVEFRLPGSAELAGLLAELREE